MREYLQLVDDVLTNGADRPDRTGTGTRSVFGRQLRFDLADGFPIVTTKYVPFGVVARELLWMLRGETNVRSLQRQGVKIWNEWADTDGNLGPVYGHQWRNWGGDTDQLADTIETIRHNPYSRRLLVTAWNPSELEDMALAPCHCLFQFYVADGRLSCQLYQRSADIGLDVPFNIAGYALLTHLVARYVGLAPGEFVHTFGDLHAYHSHFEGLTEQLKREPLALPELEIVGPANTAPWDMEPGRMGLRGYYPHPHIYLPVSV